VKRTGRALLEIFDGLGVGVVIGVRVVALLFVATSAAPPPSGSAWRQSSTTYREIR
jgi:hypothetical protein